MIRLTLLATLLLLAGWSVSSGRVDLGPDRMKAVQQGGVMHVSWESVVEENVDLYVLRRETSFSVQLQEVARIPPKGPGKYEFTDSDIYKAAADNVTYVLFTVYGGSTQEVELTRVSTRYTSTSVRRTWGSIKAMFQ